MITHLNCGSLPLFKEKRLISEVDKADQVTQAVEKATEAEKVAAAVLEDNDVLWDTSETDGKVREFLDSVTEKVDKEIRDFTPEKKDAVLETDFLTHYTGQETVNPKHGAAVSAAIGTWETAGVTAINASRKTQMHSEVGQLDTEYKDKEKDETYNTKKAAIEAKYKDLTADEAWKEAFSTDVPNGKMSIPENMPPKLAEKVTKAESPAAAKKICDDWDKDWETAKKECDDAAKIKEHRDQYLDEMKRIAVTAVHENQQRAFDARREAFIAKTGAEMVNTLTFNKSDPTAISALREAALPYSRQYLTGALSGIALTLPKDADAAFSDASEKGKAQALTQIEQIVTVMDEAGQVPYENDPVFGTRGVNPEVAAYVDGLWYSEPPLTDTQRQWMRSRFDSIPDEKKNDLAYVKAALGTVRLENPEDIDKAYLQPSMNSSDVIDPSIEEDEGKRQNLEKLSGEMISGDKLLKNHPELAIFFQKKMAEAHAFYRPTVDPSDTEAYNKAMTEYYQNMQKYRTYLMAEIGRIPLDYDDPTLLPEGTMERLKVSVKSPGAVATGVRRYPKSMSATGRVPGELQTVKTLPAGIVPFAQKLMATLGRNKAAPGTIIEFPYKDPTKPDEPPKTYYAVYTHENLAIFTQRPPAPPKQLPEEDTLPDEASEPPAEGEPEPPAPADGEEAPADGEESEPEPRIVSFSREDGKKVAYLATGADLTEEQKTLLQDAPVPTREDQMLFWRDGAWHLGLKPAESEA